MSMENRIFTRVVFDMKAELIISGQIIKIDTIDNLSIGGCLLEYDEQVQPKTACEVNILMSGTRSKLKVSLSGEIIRSETDRVAVKFIEITPDSLYHLQNIVRYNAPDVDVIEEEIRNHPGLK